MAAQYEQGHELSHPDHPGEYRYFYKGNALTLDDYTRQNGAPPPTVTGGNPRADPRTGRIPITQNPEFQKRLAQTQATMAGQRLDAAIKAGQAGTDLVDNAEQAGALLDRGTPTGFGGTLKMKAGEALSGMAGGVLGIPTAKQTTNMQELRRIGGKSVLATAKQLPGPLSNSDRTYLEGLQYTVGKSNDYNRRVQAAEKWAGEKVRQYGYGMQAWINVLGSDSQPNARGQTYQQWWNEWSKENYPPPGTLPPSKRDAQNTALKERSKAAPIKQEARATGKPRLVRVLEP